MNPDKAEELAVSLQETARRAFAEMDVIRAVTYLVIYTHPLSGEPLADKPAMMLAPHLDDFSHEQLAELWRSVAEPMDLSCAIHVRAMLVDGQEPPKLVITLQHPRRLRAWAAPLVDPHGAEPEVGAFEPLDHAPLEEGFELLLGHLS